MSERKMGDDWMNPPMRFQTSYKPHPDGTFWLIERKKRIPVSGPSAFIEQWDTWIEFDTKTDRDEELKRLRETTQWVLRGSKVVYLSGHIMPGHNPREFIDV